MAEDVATRAVRLIAAVKRIPVEGITREAALEQLGFDSLDKVNLLFELESEFDIEIPDEEAKAIVTVGDIVRKLEAAVAAGEPER